MNVRIIARQNADTQPPPNARCARIGGLYGGDGGHQSFGTAEAASTFSNKMTSRDRITPRSAYPRP